MSRIRLLPEHVVDRIAAGEVVERPASVVRELVDNALDAGARRVSVELAEGGIGLVLVEDDGCGMDADDLALAVERHATSKLEDERLVRIATLGFRGEALAAIGAVARLSITSRPHGAPQAHRIIVAFGRRGEVRPAPGRPGTRVEVAELFAELPARRRFLKSASAESDAAAEVVRRIAMAWPGVAFRFTVDRRILLDLPAHADSARGFVPERIAALLGRDVGERLLQVEEERDGLVLRALLAPPAVHRNHTRHQHLFVNGRPVRDRALAGCLRAAYGDLLPQGRHPVAAVFLDLPPERVDVNVHPQKAEVRFREPERVRGFFVNALRRALGSGGVRAGVRMGLQPVRPAMPAGASAFVPAPPAPAAVVRALAEAAAPWGGATGGVGSEGGPTGSAAPETGAATVHNLAAAGPLGTARAVLFDTYIVAETPDAVVLVDQHAAHERIVYERLKAELAGSGVARQALLIPEVVELDDGEARVLVEHAALLSRLGLVVDSFGPGAVVVREVPALLAGRLDVRGLVRDLAHDLAERERADSLEAALLRVLATAACHGSVRAGRRLTLAEADALLRQIECTAGADRCNHGRPTYIVLPRGELERMFARR